MIWEGFLIKPHTDRVLSYVRTMIYFARMIGSEFSETPYIQMADLACR